MIKKVAAKVRINQIIQTFLKINKFNNSKKKKKIKV